MCKWCAMSLAVFFKVNGTRSPRHRIHCKMDRERFTLHES